MLVRPRGARGRPDPGSRRGRRPGGDGAAVRRPPRRQRPERRGRGRPAGRAGAADGPAGHRTARASTSAGTPSSPASTRAASSRPTEPVSLAVVGLAPDGSADYGFHVARRRRLAVDRRRAGARAARAAPRSCTSARSPAGPRPGCEAIARLVERLAGEGGALISVDPNIRPDARRRAGRRRRSATPRRSSASGWTGWSRHADVVKVSAEDLAWLEPDGGAPRRLDATPRAAWADRGAGAGRCSPTAAPPCGSPARATPCCTGGPRG